MDLVFAPSQIETWPLDRLRPYARNAKIHGTDQVAKIAASMAKFGWTVPCLVADDGELIAGHGRVLAAIMLGLTDVPVIRLGHLDEAERRAYRIADNKLTELGEWDEAILRDEIAGLLAEDFDLSLLGITDEDLDALLRDPDQVEGGAVEGEDDIPEPPVTPVSVAGDLWQLGSHRLICGDSTSADVVGRLLGDVRPLLMVTDPPYGVEYDPSWRNQAGAAKTIDRGTNQPNVFFDPKSSESFTPYFSRGWRDDAIQRAYLEATYLWWGQGANNPTSSVYGARMVHVPECAAWTWDARPYPFFPELTEVWTDGPNWRLGHWLTGRLGGVSLAALVRHLCLRAGMPEDLIDVSSLWGAVEGYVISALEAPRASISTLARHFGFDAVESEGRIRFLMRGRIASATVAPDGMVAPASAQGDVMELTRAQETELPQALKWQVARADEDYDAAQVEARRITVDTTRIASESFPMAIPPEEAERRCRRALMEAWVGRESAVFRLPPSRLALDPCDVILLDHDGRLTEMRLVSIADSDLRSVDAVRQDRAVYDLPPGEPRPASLSTPTVFGAPDVVLLDLPQLREDQPAHRPMVAAHAKAWPGEIAVYRSAATDGFALLTTFSSRARIGELASDFYAGPVSRFDLGNALVIDLYSGTLESVTDITLLGGANALAVETGAGHWEIVQAGTAELIAPGRYRLTRLLRGQRGTEGAMVSIVPSGARVVVLDAALTSLRISEADLGLPWNWRIGPAAKPVSDETFVATAFTPEGAGLRPFSVAHVEQPWCIARSPGDLTIRWTRRSRSLAADTWGAGDVPLAEDSEAYEVEILDGATRKRTLQVATTGALYTAAQQTSDWGAPLGPGQSLVLRIYQLSALIGRGAGRSVTLSF